MDKFYIIFTISSISTLLPFLASTIFFKRFKGMDGNTLLWTFFFVSALTDIVLFVLSVQSRRSAWIPHIYTVIEYVLVAAILSNWQTRKTGAKFMRMSIQIFISLFVLIKVTGIENFSPDTINYITRPLAVLLLNVFVLYTSQTIWSQTSENLAGDYRFWMLLAMALYYSTSLVLFAFMYTKNTGLLLFLFEVHAVVNILHNVLFTIGVFCARRARL